MSINIAVRPASFVLIVHEDGLRSTLIAWLSDWSPVILTYGGVIGTDHLAALASSSSFLITDDEDVVLRSAAAVPARARWAARVFIGPATSLPDDDGGLIRVTSAGAIDGIAQALANLAAMREGGTDQAASSNPAP